MFVPPTIMFDYIVQESFTFPEKVSKEQNLNLFRKRFFSLLIIHDIRIRSILRNHNIVKFYSPQRSFYDSNYAPSNVSNSYMKAPVWRKKLLSPESARTQKHLTLVPLFQIKELTCTS